MRKTIAATIGGEFESPVVGADISLKPIHASYFSFVNFSVLYLITAGKPVIFLGGSYSNLLAMNMARIKRFPESKNDGIYGLPKLVSFCSEQAHYSAQKNSALLGFGETNCRTVKCDERGKMIPAELEKKIQQAKDEVTFELASCLN